MSVPRGGYAVMAQTPNPDDLVEDFPTPPWATRALLEHIAWSEGETFLEPSCNRGFMSEVLREAAGDHLVTSGDIVDYGYPHQNYVKDFLSLKSGPKWDWVVTNPPFKLAEKFIEKGLSVSREGVAVLVRAQFLEGVGRYERLFSVNPPALVAQFSERVPMVKGRYDPKASTATAYCWLVWSHRKRIDDPTDFFWIPPCRVELERPEDAILPVDRLGQMP